MMDVSVSRLPPSMTVMLVCFLVLMGANMMSVVGSPGGRKLIATEDVHSGSGVVDRTSRKIVGKSRGIVELQCPITRGQHVEWYKQNPGGRGKKRITQFRNRYELSNGEMKIHSLASEDGGTYVCKVSNKTELHYIQLVVSGEQAIKNNHLKLNRKGSNEENYSEPQILKNLLPKQKVYHVSKGFPVFLLKCESSGNPKPTITWYKNGAMISSSTTNISTLKLLNVSHADSGNYKCESGNLFGVSKYEITIKVTDYWFGASEILELTPHNVTVLEGSSVNISCVAKFEMDPWFSWVRKVPSNKTEGDKVFFHVGTSSYYEVLKNTIVKPSGEGGVFSTDLVITNLTKNDSGVYFCAVAGLQGYNLSDVTINVEPGPSDFLNVNQKGVAAQWAILWTISFVFLVMLVVFCFVNLYGCRTHKPTIKPAAVPTLLNTDKSQHCHLPESSPLTMSTQCTIQESFVPLMVGGGSGSCSGPSSSFGDSYEYDSPTASNALIYQHQHHHQHQHSHYPPAFSWISSNNSETDFCDAISYRPNSMCSDYQCNSSVSNPSTGCHRACCHGVVVPRSHHTGRKSNKPVERIKSHHIQMPPPTPLSPWETNYPLNYDVGYCQSMDGDSCISPVSHPEGIQTKPDSRLYT